jgi:hypothetical protein
VLGAYSLRMNTEANWIDTLKEVPPALMTIEVEHNGAASRVRYRGLDRWETLDGKQTDVPIRWRFRPCEPGSTGHFMR